ncbi:uncharacterized protein LOC124455036 isoform X2 [Xenia sp. Carnegie-2017]|uniref:uncharacterized protein LOC124455036 isoform X2 n=1 Tax=Xenia sp. Carnegie-2017 TaxID=2897299 RepID=UPI001F03912A|nr:uncharacterized protein LOC124455036 isoform X2 [Xenia sp. Carnegie-2017]
MYELLRMVLSYSLLQEDFKKLKEWANENFSIQGNLCAAEVFKRLDERKIISHTDLTKLRNFFSTINRYDLVSILDDFNMGNYKHLKEMVSKIKHKFVESRERRNRYRSTATVQSINNEDSYNLSSLTSRDNNLLQSKPAQIVCSNNQQSSSRTYKISTRDLHGQPCNSKMLPVAHATTNERNNSISTNFAATSQPQESVFRFGNPVIVPTQHLHDVPLSTSTQRLSTINGLRRPESNGQSEVSINAEPYMKPEPQCNSHDHAHCCPPRTFKSENWLCTHYKRRCYVQFECCDKYWPCHRCHNNQSTCGEKKLKSRDAKMVKCAECGKEQKFGENGQFCVSCQAKFADYYCGICKHLTGLDDKPYHCDKCGICRVHGDRSYHCDVCGICLDVQLRGNHKCRPNSAHDACCICLEDAFTGCQILPCSHKVHKECANQMIQNGM